MQFDRRMLEQLLTMNDEQLRAVIEKIATQSGIDPAQLGINAESIQSIRRVLGNAGPDDLKQFQGIYDAYRSGRQKP